MLTLITAIFTSAEDEVMFPLLLVCLFVCLIFCLSTRLGLLKKLWTDFHEIL